MTVRKKRESFRKQTLRQRCMTCTFSPLDNPEVGCVVTGGAMEEDRQTVSQEEPEKERSEWKGRNE